MKKIEFCSICKKVRGKQWSSDMAIFYGEMEIRRFTVCPQCREYSLKEIFKKLIREDVK